MGDNLAWAKARMRLVKAERNFQDIEKAFQQGHNYLIWKLSR